MKYIIGIKHPKRGNLFLRNLQRSEAHVTTNENLVTDSAVSTSISEAKNAINRAEARWRKSTEVGSTRSRNRCRELIAADKVIVKLPECKIKKISTLIISMEEFSNGQD